MENAIKKFSIVREHAMVLELVGVIMYGKGNDIDNDLVDWAFAQLDKVTNTKPRLDVVMST